MSKQTSNVEQYTAESATNLTCRDRLLGPESTREAPAIAPGCLSLRYVLRRVITLFLLLLSAGTWLLPRQAQGKCWMIVSLVSVLWLGGCQTNLSNVFEPSSVQRSTSGNSNNIALVGRLGGPSLSITVRDHYAYLGQSFEFAVLDIADPLHPRRVAYLPLSANKIVLAGDYAYVAGRNGLSIVNITRPDAPRLAGFLATPEVLADLAVSNGYAFLAAPRTGLYTVNISQPNTPIQVNFMHLPRIDDLTVAGHSVYVATREGLQRFDMTEPTHLRLIASTTASEGTQAVAVAGQFAYMATAHDQFAVVALAESTQFQSLQALDLPGFGMDVQVKGDYAYVATDRAGLCIIAIADPAHPRLIHTLAQAGVMQDITVTGHYLYATDAANGGLYIFDIANQAQPRLAGRFQAPGAVADVTIQGHYAYLAAGLQGGNVDIVDIADPTDLREVGIYHLPDTTWRIAASSYCTCLYVSVGQDAFYRLDISSPTQPTLQGAMVLPGPSSRIIEHDHFAYVVDGAGVLHVLNLSASTWLAEAGVYRSTGKTLDVAVTPTYAFVAAGKAGLLVVDMTDRTQPHLAARVETTGSVDTVTIAGHYAYSTVQGYGLQIIDIAKPRVPQLVGVYETSHPLLQIVVQDSYAFIAAEEAGLLILDLADPTAPKVIAQYATPDRTLGLAVKEQTIYLADSLGGLLVLRAALPDHH